ncbi:N-acetylglucosamine-6-phosphate deacetylase [Arthrobacter caoxuetaonis]|uniref:Amidohydrolase family protein n=1 Tax=Arthrobacter caoxuetaonis TaxID=2886935 RepID=A0A9X1ME94_9MICC|nr:amidohydrolase family protein [Arthrobacter caoxuetaonis]MCC3298418.1 amidohydrolase family protein [Arthrobacter caoxuetaonis]USQ57566.1 amidohydrolase family protein [Arthrobacter caoxuetaonis]
MAFGNPVPVPADQPAGQETRLVLRGAAVIGARTVPDAAVAVDGGALTYAGPQDALEPCSGDVVVELSVGEVVLPGFVDLHCHGAYGVDFSRADGPAVRDAAAKLHADGTTTLLASLVTDAPEALLRQLTLLAGLAEEGLVAGIHLEGPFLAAARCGAQDPRWLRDPDLGLARELIAAGRGQLRTMTYAPELPGADALVELLTENGVIPSLGHTASPAGRAGDSLALSRQLLAASAVGAEAARPTVTHLFNGMDPIHHRAPGAVAACLRAATAGAAAVELIADNTHLDPYLVAAMFELLGAGNIALVTDSMAAAGLSDGQYRLGPAEVTVSGGVARLASTGSIAGGTAAMLDLVRNAVGAGVSLADAVTSAAAVPAGVLGRRDVGRLVAGGAADFVVIGPDLERVRVMRRGQWL